MNYLQNAGYRGMLGSVPQFDEYAKANGMVNMPEIQGQNMYGGLGSPTVPGTQSKDPYSYDLGSMDAWFGEGQLAKAGLGVGNSLMNAWQGMQNIKLGKETLAQDKAFKSANLENQAKLLNNKMESRQIARMGANGQSVNASSPEIQAYMQANGVRGKI